MLTRTQVLDVLGRLPGNLKSLKARCLAAEAMLPPHKWTIFYSKSGIVVHLKVTASKDIIALADTEDEARQECLAVALMKRYPGGVPCD